VDAACLILMVVLTADIFLGVFSRYVLQQTFTWYDEIARVCFVWMVFLGAAAGVRRGAHFRLHLLVSGLPARGQQAIELFGGLVAIGFALALVHYGWALVELGQFQQTPVMGLSKWWVYLAVPVGGALIALNVLPPTWRSLVDLLH
jgi:TRAP-type C4-dicarboxylate transport system permease small subunit